MFADDGLLLVETVENATIIIDKLEEVGGWCGLTINKEKSNHIININNENIRNINNIEVFKSFRYLGMQINEGKNCFREHKADKIISARKYSNMIMSVIAKSSNKLMIGKTYWKNVILAEILYGAELTTFTKKEIEELQRAENQAYRYILDAPRYSPVCTLRGEIGATAMKNRDITNKIKFAKHLLQSENKLVRQIADLDYANKTTKFIKTTQKYMEEIKINKEDLLIKTPQQIKEIVQKIDDEQWREEMNGKTTLAIYNIYKEKIKEESEIYDNSEESKLLFKARTNTLNLNWRSRFKRNLEEQNILCPMCQREEETLEHFLLTCPNLMNIRSSWDFWKEDEPGETLKILLCFDKKTKGKKCLKELWKERQKTIPREIPLRN